MRKLKTGYSDYTADQLNDLAGKVGPAISDNTKFSGLASQVTTLGTERADLQLKMAAKGPGAATALHASMATIAATLGSLAEAAMKTTGVTEEDLETTLFPLQKERERSTNPPAAPEDLRLKHGRDPGQVLGVCEIDPADHVRTIEPQWTLDPVNGPWSNADSTTSSRGIDLQGLPRGKDVWVRVRGRNSVGAGPWSDPATIMPT